MATNILVINGPNLNLLGTRQPHIYGVETLEDVEGMLNERAISSDIKLQTFQSNHEGAIVDRIHSAKKEGVQVVIINPGALGHYSIALRDALLAIDVKFIEIHISNNHSREVFRQTSVLSDKAWGVIAGLGTYGYIAAFDYAVNKFN